MAETETVAAPESAQAPPGGAIDQGGAPPSWLAGLPEPLRAEKSLASFRDVGALAQSYVETKKLVGAKTDGLVRVPGADATPEQVAAYRKAAGVPETPEGYQISRPEIALTGGWDAQAEKDFLGLAHKHHLPPAAAQALVNWYGNWEAQKLATAQQQATEVMGTLRREMGPNYEANLGRANRLITEVDKAVGGGFINAIGQSGLGRNGFIVKGFAWLAQQMVESGAMETAGDMGTSVDEAKERLEAIKRDPKHPYNAGGPGFDEARDEVLALRRVLLGSENKKLIEYR